MRVEEHHAHADTRYKEIGLPDFINLFSNLKEVKRDKHLSLNVHIPFELQHHTRYTYLRRLVAKTFLLYGELMKRIVGVKLYWENAPELVYGEWSLKHSQSSWDHIPRWIELTLDTGHLILGAKSVDEARERIKAILRSHGNQIKHLHIHENDLKHDKHWHTNDIINDALKNMLMKGRTYIFEKGE